MPSRLQAGVVFDVDVEAESDVIVGSTIGNAIAFEVFALAVGFATASWTVSTVVILAGATVAVSWVGLT
jgi:hypothetical protein